MWQSIPRTGSLLLRVSRSHSFQRFTLCLLSSLHASLPASSVSPAASSPPSMPRFLRPAVYPLPPLSSLHASLPALSGLPAASSPPSMPRSLRSAVSPLPPLLPPCHTPCAQRFPRCLLLSSLHASLPASSVSPAASSPPSMLLSLRSAVYPLSLSPPDPVSPPLKHNKIS